MTKVNLIEIRCVCGKLLGRVQEGAAHEHKCPNSKCKKITILAGKTLDTVTADEWNRASEEDREEFITRWRKKGIVSFRCLNCGFPTSIGVARCNACRNR